MADFPVGRPWQLVLPDGMFWQLRSHLFPGDGDEHGAVIAAGIAVSDRRVRLLARNLFLAEDGKDYVPGRRGYRMLKAEFIADRIDHCQRERLVYLAVHNHGGRDSVAFSRDDLESHERGYPALLDNADGLPVGALVFAKNAVAGDIWLPDGTRVELEEASAVGVSALKLRPTPRPRPSGCTVMYDRQARLFGDAGQDMLKRAKIGIIGLGGAGSLLAEYLGRLGVGNFVLVDPDRAEITNLPRLVAARQSDAIGWLFDKRVPRWLRSLAAKLAAPKVSLARRNILRANPTAHVDAVFADFLETDVAVKFTDCDYLFLAADTMRSRLLFNAIVHQYLIPGIQVGAKVNVDADSGDVLDAFSVVRPVTPENGCLLCNGLINGAKLQEESISEEERRRQRYVDEPEVSAPSVITMNAVATAHAANDFLFYFTGMQTRDSPATFLRVHGMGREVQFDATSRQPGCLECSSGSGSRLARGDGKRLPTVFQS